MQQAPIKNPTLWATIVLSNKNSNIRKNNFKLEKIENYTIKENFKSQMIC